MVRRVYFPREVPVLAAVAGASVDFGIGLVLFAVVGPFLGANVSRWWLLPAALRAPGHTLRSAVAIPLAAMNVLPRLPVRDPVRSTAMVVRLACGLSPVRGPTRMATPMWR